MFPEKAPNGSGELRKEVELEGEKVTSVCSLSLLCCFAFFGGELSKGPQEHVTLR